MQYVSEILKTFDKVTISTKVCVLIFAIALIFLIK